MVQKRMRKEFGSFVCFTVLQRNSWPQQTHSCARAHRQTYTHTQIHTNMQARTLTLCTSLWFKDLRPWVLGLPVYHCLSLPKRKVQ
jgi:hypothetical protein